MSKPGFQAVAADYLDLCKPKVVALIVFTAMVGMLLAVPGMVPIDLFILGSIGIGLAAASAAAINHYIDRKIDAEMARTRKRPLPTGHLKGWQVLSFAAVLGLIAMALLWFLVNPLTAVLTLASLVGYAIIYTVFLKRATPQNIVIGGAAGAAPPVLGWAAITGEVHPHALLLFLIIFTWTPPHFWALAIHRREEYAKVDMPMLPVTHGVSFTGWHIIFYTVLLLLVTLLPWLTGMSGLLYLVSAVILGVAFLAYTIALKRDPDGLWPMKTFGFSITYLILLFAALMVDHYLTIWLAN
ncbi:protoheme IX farnesyltransferase [Natronospira proteinivora]|uniref:Protoheme IX farnesyltransferase n=1 Tax=Natronospira proteinivora TaxID=1807133 RepID=A0ABT1G9G4_9GAMM|nr:heme o synthase [Natronospira proteinivora]MCP1727944.1 protoheme IX farnesyltransferase [Natronospira proteinivora]